ncbi:MAG: multiheme c-type cytochrome, partial [Myxococcota bacterium]
MLRFVKLGTLFAAVLATALLACDESKVEAASPAEEARAAPVAADAIEKTAPVETTPTTRRKPDPHAASTRSRSERPLPAFSGWTLGGERLDVSSLMGKRLLLFFFNPEVKDAPAVNEAVTRISGLRGKHNFEIVGVATGSNRDTARRFVQDQGIDFRVIDDSNAAITRRLGLRSPLAMLGVDSEGYVTFGIGQFPTDGPDPAKVVENTLRAALRPPSLAKTAQPELGTRPRAPTFRADVLDGDVPFDLAEHRGKAVVLIFFLHTCPHCHQALESLRGILEDMPKDKRPVLVGLEVTGRTRAVRDALAERKLDFFPVIFDADGRITDDYGVFGGVPDTFLIDTEGRIAARIDGWREQTDPSLVRMRLAQLAGVPVPMLLRAKGYSGNDACGVCHENEHATWMMTQHAGAFGTLVKHSASNNPECVGCHVAGYGEPGGFSSSIDTPYLENVGCESCHGRGGPHLSPGFVKNSDYGPVCRTCHDTTHSLGFEYARFLPRISHAANAHLLSLPLEEKRKLLAERGVKRADLLPTKAPLVGSDACNACHPSEFATWMGGGHARAGTTLVEAGKASDADCLGCHTTGMGRNGGFPDGGAVADHP